MIYLYIHVSVHQSICLFGCLSVLKGLVSLTPTALQGYWRFEPRVWDTYESQVPYEYVPNASCAGKEGQSCLFPNDGWVLMKSWKQEPMTCMRLPGGGDELFCARQILAGETSIAPGDGNASDFGNASRVTIVRCPIGACAENNTCLQNRIGDICISLYLSIYMQEGTHLSRIEIGA